ncbi:unnamed protein product [Durusdinium trenchii]|uniref:Pseudouridine synthase RsuA/RluA-like domain-containing protein n=2 Tax=Durusdinium trenchii TaxID=1381693 RepID=A0ABP0P4N3_9DINO
MARPLQGDISVGRLVANSKLATAYLYGITWRQGAKEAQQVLLNFLDRGMEANAFHANAIIGACHARDWRMALFLLVGMGDLRMRPDGVSYNAAINVLEKASRWSLALHWLREMRNSGLQPSAIGYSALLNGGQSRWKMILSTWSEAKVAGLDTGTMGCSAAIRACSAWWHAAEVLSSMNWFRIPADRCTYNAALHGIRSQWQRASHLSRTVTPDAVGANTVINACARAGRWAQTLAQLEDMAVIHLETDVFSCSTALSACGLMGTWAFACHVLAQSAMRKIHPNHVTMGTAVGCCGGHWEVASDLMMGLPELRLASDLIMCNSHLGVCAAAGRWEVVLETLAEQREADRGHGVRDRFQRDGISFTAGISACEKGSQWTWTVKLLEMAMHEVPEVTADDVCFNAAIDACARATARAPAWALLSEAERSVEVRDVSSLPWALARLHCQDASVVLDVFKDVVTVVRDPKSLSPKRWSLMTWAFAMLGVPVASHEVFREAIMTSLDDFNIDELSILSWGMMDLDATSGLRIQLAAVREMGRAIAPNQDWVSFANSVLGVVWAWNFSGCLAMRLARQAQAVLAQGSREMDRRKGTRNLHQEAEDGPCATRGISREYRDPWVVLDMSEVLVIAKPPGWEVYDGNAERQLADYLVNLQRGRLPILTDLKHGCGFIHRLDVPSSGLVIAATTYHAWYDLQFQLVTGTLLREYLVLAHGFVYRDPNARWSTIAALLRWSDDAVAAAHGMGKPSETRLRVLGHVTDPSGRSFALLVIRIVTGRKHQIRSHLAWKGHATVTDGKYTGPQTLTEDLRLCARNFLHRCHLSLRRGTVCVEEHHVWQPLALDLVEALRELRPKDLAAQKAQETWCSSSEPAEFMCTEGP